MKEPVYCERCGEEMPEGMEMYRYHESCPEPEQTTQKLKKKDKPLPTPNFGGGYNAKRGRSEDPRVKELNEWLDCHPAGDYRIVRNPVNGIETIEVYDKDGERFDFVLTEEMTKNEKNEVIIIIRNRVL